MLIGWASADVTPERPVILRGQHHVRVSENVNDSVTVTALALEEQDETAVIVSCDLVGITAATIESLRRRINEKMPEFDVSRLFASVTHTHTGPTLDEGIYPEQPAPVMTPAECNEFFIERVSEAVIQAWRTRKPGGISWAFGQAVVGHNRRAVYFGGNAQMYGKTNTEDFDSIEGYEDHSVDLLYIWDEQQKLTGVLVNLACPSQVTENAYFVSADFWHEARQEIRKRLSADLFILPQCAAAGDQSPHFLVYGDQEKYMRERRGVSEREEIGIKIADAVQRALPAAQGDIRTELDFRHVAQEVQLPVRMVTDEELASARAEIQKLEKQKAPDPKAESKRLRFISRNTKVVERYEHQKTNPTLPIELHVLRIGDVAMATNPFELFLDFGLRIKARSAALQTFVVQLAAGCLGYVPTAKAVAAKSYGAEVASNRVGPEGGQVLVEKTLECIAGLWRE